MGKDVLSLTIGFSKYFERTVDISLEKYREMEFDDFKKYVCDVFAATFDSYSENEFPMGIFDNIFPDDD